MSAGVSAAPQGYESAHEGAAYFDRGHRTRLFVTGRAPGQMLGGVVTGRIPGLGECEYSAVLTPKGRMVSDLIMVRLPGDAERYLLDVPSAGRDGLLQHFKRVMPPRLAKVEDSSAAFGHYSLVGPSAPSVMSSVLAAVVPSTVDGVPDATALEQLAHNQAWCSVAEPHFVLLPSGDTTLPGFDLVYPIESRSAVIGAFEAAGVPLGGDEAWETLRVEAGTPHYGFDMTEETIPIEAGIEEQAIDGTKGCYTGQEVIVRILHRGHVNRHLRTLILEDEAQVDDLRGLDVFASDPDKARGRVTSAVYSPVIGRAVCLGYVRREVEPGSTVRLGSASGPSAIVRERGPVV